MNCLCFLIASCLLMGHVTYTTAATNESELLQVKGVITTILHDNAEFSKLHPHAYFQRFAKSQHPRATVVTCSDSRVHDQAFEHSPDNDLFIVRDIGNQIKTAEGSVEYGIRHLHTPVLLIVGHSACGAVKAASSNYENESPAIRHELETIRLDHSINVDDDKQVMLGVVDNVNHQVEFAMHKFSDETKTGKLIVVGAVYDFANTLHYGDGRLVIVNIDGDSNKQHIAQKLSTLLRHDTHKTGKHHE